MCDPYPPMPNISSFLTFTISINLCNINGSVRLPHLKPTCTSPSNLRSSVHLFILSFPSSYSLHITVIMANGRKFFNSSLLLSLCSNFTLLTFYSFGISAPFKIPFINHPCLGIFYFRCFHVLCNYSIFSYDFILFIANCIAMSKVVVKTRPSFAMTLFISGKFSYPLLFIRLPIE